MLGFSGKAINIRRNEWFRLMLLYSIAFLFFLGLFWGETIITASFLREVGVDYYFYVFLINALLSILITAIYSAFVDRISNSTLLVMTLIFSTLAVAIGFAVLESGYRWSAYIALLIVVRVVRSSFNLHWWTYVGDYYDTRASKRIVPVLNSASRVAIIIGGASLPFLADIVIPGITDGIIAIWIGILIVVTLLGWLAPRLVRSETPSTASRFTGRQETQRKSFWGNIREGYAFAINSPYLRWMSFSTVLMVIIFSLLAYQGEKAISTSFESRDEIAIFLARLNMVISLVMLPLQVLVINRFIARVGVGNANMIFPTGTLVIAASIIAAPFSLVSASLANFDRTAFRFDVREPTNSLLYNAVPAQVKGRARAFIDGMMVPVGLIIGSSLIFVLPRIQADWALEYAIFVILGVAAFGFFTSGIVIRRQYSQAFLDMLEREDITGLLSLASTQNISDSHTINLLKRQLDSAEKVERKVFVARLLAELGGSQALPILKDMALEGDAYVRMCVVEILAETTSNTETSQNQYEDFWYTFLDDEDSRVRRAALIGMQNTMDTHSDEFLEVVEDMLGDDDIKVRLTVIPALMQTGDVFYLASTAQELTKILGDPDPQMRMGGIQVLEQVDDPRFIRTLLLHIDDPVDDVRSKATNAIELLSRNPMPNRVREAALKSAGNLINDPVESVRQSAVNILDHIDSDESIGLLSRFLTDPSQQVRESVVEILIRKYQHVRDMLQTLQRDPNNDVAKMAAVVLCRIDHLRYSEVILKHVQDNLATIYKNYTYLESIERGGAFRGIKLLISTLKERNRMLRDEIFYLLSAIYGVEEIRLIRNAFTSTDSRVRANAAEALESLTGAQIVRFLTPMFEPDLTFADMRHHGTEEFGLEVYHPVETIINVSQSSQDDWLRAIMIFALGDLSVAMHDYNQNGARYTADKDGSTHFVKILLGEIQYTEDHAQRRLSDRVSGLLGLSDDLRRTRATTEAEAILSADDEDKKKSGSSKDINKRETEELSIHTTKTQPLPKYKGKGSNLAETPGDSDDFASDEGNALPELSEEDAIAALEVASGDAVISGKEKILTPQEIAAILRNARSGDNDIVQQASTAAMRIISDIPLVRLAQQSEGQNVLSTIEKIIFLKDVPFFQSMTIDQLKVLASVCEEQLFSEDDFIYQMGEAGGAVYVVVNGKVAIELEGQRKGSIVRMGTMEANQFFGEMTLFDDSSRNANAIALSDTLVLKLRREPLLALIRKHPDLSTEIINVLTERLREANDTIAGMQKGSSRQMVKIWDVLDD